jgi:TolB-like protein/DNA-binding winged helix-turn-helix (wHTH) protein
MPRIYRIGELTLDAGRQEVRCGAKRVHVGELTYRLLLALIEAAPNVITHDELAKAVWDGRAVSNETISQRIKLLREAIGDDPHKPRYIEMLRGRGYRLIPPVVPAADKAASRPRILAIGIAAVSALVVTALLWRQSGLEPAGQSNPSIAVLPFTDMSPGHDQEYLADGIAAEILNLLSRSTPLKVIAQTSSFSFKGQNADVKMIAQRLNVSYVLEGSVRESGGRIRINAHLVSASDGMQVWSDTYDRDIRDVLTLQREVASSVAAALETSLIGDDRQVGAAPKQVKPDSFTAYLRGEQQLRMSFNTSVAEAVRYFEKSIEIDPSFLPAYNSLGLIYLREIRALSATVTENLPKLRTLVEQARKIAPDESAVLLALEAQIARYEGDIDLAEQRLERAVDLDPSNVLIAQEYAIFKLDQGFPDESLQIVLQLIERDPLNLWLYVGVWACHMDRGNTQAAIQATMHIDQVARPWGPPIAGGARAMTRALLLGDIVGSIRDSESKRPGSLAEYPLLYYTLGDQEKGDAALKGSRQFMPPKFRAMVSYFHAYRHLLTGEIDKARRLAREAFMSRDDFSAGYDDYYAARLTIDALIADGDAERAVELIEKMAPVYATYRSRPDMNPREFSPAPYSVKGAFSSYPAYYFPDYIRALRAAGDPAGADNMLRHLEAILKSRKERGLFVEGRHFAEARILRGDVDGALDALEQAEQEGTLYIAWHAFLLHSGILAGIRDHPRFEALIVRVQDEMRRQRGELEHAS